MPFSLVDSRTRSRLNLPTRTAQKQSVVEYARSSWTSSGIFSAELRRRVDEVRDAPANSPEKIARIQAKIRKAVGNAIPLDKAAQKRQLRIILKMIDCHFFKNTIEDGLAAWKAYSPGRKFEAKASLSEENVQDEIVGLTILDEGHGRASVGIDYDSLFNVNSRSSVGKIKCRRKVDCLILLALHEALHAFLFLFFEKSMRLASGPHGQMFRRLLRKIGNQKTIYHDL